MSAVDQCPSTHGPKAKEVKPGAAELASRARELPTVNGQKAWRSLDEWCDTPGFREHLEQEFPHGALEMQRAFESGSDGGETRRDFLKVMGASMALAGIAVIPGCRRPDHKILTYSRDVPEEIIPGKPLYYATAMARPGYGAEGLIVETHEGRPTKIEGNPLHPGNQGRASTWALASILGLYDPDRLKFPRFKNPSRQKPASDEDPDKRLDATWDDFRAWSADHFKQHATDGGEGLAFIVEKKSSPSRDAAKAAVMAKYPKATWIAYDALEATGAVEGAKAAFGAAMRPRLSFSLENTKVVVSFDADFLAHGHDDVRHAREFAATRRVMTTHDAMSRLYSVESVLSTTGGQADHRLRLAPSRIPGFVAAFARFLIPKLGSPDAAALVSALEKLPQEHWESSEQRFLEECAKDLADAANREKTLIVAGDSLPASCHALVHAMNAALGNLGRSVTMLPMSEEEASSSHAQLATLAAAMSSGKIKTLVCVDANPVYNAPAEIGFADAFAKVPATITLSVGQSETALASTWSLNGAHYLEAWGDVRAADGTLSVVQPMIAPLYEPAMSEIELLALLASGGDFKAKVDGYELVRAQWRTALGESGFDAKWRRALHDGLVASTATPATNARVNYAGVAKAIEGMKAASAPSAQALDVVFEVGKMHDGRFANASWLQELQAYGTLVVWDNPALMSPATAKALNVLPAGYKDTDPSRIYTKPKYPMAPMVKLTLGGRTLEIPVWIMPGMADNTIALTFGYGRTACGLVGDGVGFNTFALRTASMGRTAQGAAIEKTGDEFLISSTQNNWSMEGRGGVARAVDLAAWKKHGDETAPGGATRYKHEPDQLKFAERLGELAHTPPNESIYANPYNKSTRDAEADATFANGQQWGMSIDLSACNGCGACTVACQSENNIPVVGKKETAKGREMTWIRVDRYFTGDDINDPAAIHHQPVACVHCENAPCEVVCPVNATVHGPEGINYMTYNRCIGTRYCANNCPYKVRRYNFFEFGKLRFNGGYVGKGVIDGAGEFIPGQGVGPNGSSTHNKININFIPPRLRDKIAEIERMGKNPNVSVRMRGVMEKCSYCVQRINAARIECKVNDVKGPDGTAMIPDGFFTTACAQACPSEAITFGDILDDSSKVQKMRNNPRSYMLLGFLNTRPRTLHMARVMNPNPALRAPVEDPFHHGGHEGDGHGGGDGTHAAEKPAHAFRFDRRKRASDTGYALSLNVIDPAAVRGVKA